MPTPSTRTPVRIARGSYSNLNSSISDLQDGEIVYAEDQDKLYVKEGSSLVVLTQPAASPTFTGAVTVDGGGNLIINAQGDIRLADSDSSNYVGFQAPGTVSSNIVWTLPAADGSSGQQLSTNGSGVLSWSAATNTAAADLTGSTLASGVTASSLTSVGTLTGLTVNGDVTFTGASSNGLWDKSANAFVANVTGNLTGNVTGDLTGTADLATSITVTANNTTDETVYPLFVDGTTGTQGAETDTGLTYNPSTGNLTSTTFTGNVVGNVTGNCSGTAATVTTAAQSNITSVGTLTGLTVAGNYAQTLSADGGFTATAAGNHAIQIIGDTNRSADQNTLLSLHGKWNGTNVAMIDIQAGNDTTNKDNGQIVFYTAAAGSTAEALRIHEDQSAVFTGTVEVSKSGGSDAAKLTLTGGEGNIAALYLVSDEGDDNGDFWSVQASPSDNNLYFLNKTSGSYVTKAQVTEEGEVHDALGDVRAIPENATTSAYTLVAADRGKCVTNTSGGVTIPYNTFATGDAVTIVNHSGSNITITQGSNLTLYNSADAATGNRTLAARGMATVWFEAQNLAYISGAGLS